MPNWCSNTLTVTGPKEDLEAFAKAARGLTPPHLGIRPAGGKRKVDARAQEEKRQEIARAEAAYGNALASDQLETLSLHSLAPIPRPILNGPFDGIDSKYSVKNFGGLISGQIPAPDGYWWRLQNWGTKWEVDAHLEVQDKALIYTFESAWSPPVKAIVTGSKSWPRLRFKIEYDEPGVGFSGYAIIKAGKITEEVDQSGNEQED